MTEVKKQLLAILALVEQEEQKLLDIDAKNLPQVVSVLAACKRDYVSVKLEIHIHRGEIDQPKWGIYDNMPKSHHYESLTLKGAFESWKSSIDLTTEVNMGTIAETIQPSVGEEILETAASV